MNIFFIFCLFIFWTLFWSFASVLIYRLKSWEWGIWWGRSHCKDCDHTLSVRELIPIFSWLFQRGKCSSCWSKISAIYPLLELTTGLLFSFVWVFLISPELIVLWSPLEWWRLIFFCFLMFLTVIYVFYDIVYLEIPESILMIANICVFWALIIQWFGYEIIPYLATWWWSLMAIVVSCIVIWVLYYIVFAELKEVYDCLLILWCIILLILYMQYFSIPFWDFWLLSGTIAALGIYISFFLQIICSWWKAMWAGDLRIGILMWLIVWGSFALPAWMICYLVGSIVWIYIICKSKLFAWWKAKFTHQIPFWPFIACGYLSILFFSPYISSIIDWYLN